MKAIIEILGKLGIDSVADMDINEYHTIEVDGFNDLTVEKIGENRLSVKSHYVQRGDVMSDPEIVYRVEDGEWTPVRYTQHPRIHQHDEGGLDLDGFPSDWSDNLRAQGFVEAV